MCVCWEVLRVIYSKKRIFILDVLFYFVVLYHIKIFYFHSWLPLVAVSPLKQTWPVQFLHFARFNPNLFKE
jgi:hypothetical protein